jgi:dinuclear metal center YbgI/SA1388 family protein
MQSASLSDLVSFLNNELNVNEFRDVAHNGLQIESDTTSVGKIAFAVDAGLSVIQEAVRRGAHLLVVHHGLLWGSCLPVTGVFAQKIRLCMSHGLSLYAAHLPLDGHQVLGNAAQLGQYLGITTFQPCFDYHGKPLGIAGSFATPRELDEIAHALSQCEGGLKQPLILAFGARSIRTVGIATGSATSCIPETVQRGLDLLITGEPKQECYHSAKDRACSVICMGHYASETFGVRALERVLSQRFGVETTWINEPTGI